MKKLHDGDFFFSEYISKVEKTTIVEGALSGYSGSGVGLGRYFPRSEPTLICSEPTRFVK